MLPATVGDYLRRAKVVGLVGRCPSRSTTPASSTGCFRCRRRVTRRDRCRAGALPAVRYQWRVVEASHPELTARSGMLFEGEPLREPRKCGAAQRGADPARGFTARVGGGRGPVAGVLRRAAAAGPERPHRPGRRQLDRVRADGDRPGPGDGGRPDEDDDPGDGHGRRTRQRYRRRCRHCRPRASCWGWWRCGWRTGERLAESLCGKIGIVGGQLAAVRETPRSSPAPRYHPPAGLGRPTGTELHVATQGYGSNLPSSTRNRRRS